MTTLVAVQGPDWVVIGADARATEDGGLFMDLAIPKIVQNGQYLIAISGASRGGNIAQFGWTPPRAPRSRDLTTLDKFVTSKLIPALRHAFVEAGYEGKEDGEAAVQDSNFLIAFNGVVYQINEDYSWDRELRNIYVGGSGGQLALGAMAAQHFEKAKTPAQVEKMIKAAIEYSCQWSAYSAPPVTVMTQHA